MATELKNIRILSEDQFASLSTSGGYSADTLHFVELPIATYITKSANVQGEGGTNSYGYKVYSDKTVEIWGTMPNNGTSSKFAVKFGGDEGVLHGATIETATINIQVTAEAAATANTTGAWANASSALAIHLVNDVTETGFNILLPVKCVTTQLTKFHWKVTGTLTN